jgi:hypothetical protein
MASDGGYLNGTPEDGSGPVDPRARGDEPSDPEGRGRLGCRPWVRSVGGDIRPIRFEEVSGEPKSCASGFRPWEGFFFFELSGREFWQRKKEIRKPIFASLKVAPSVSRHWREFLVIRSKC